MMRLFRSSALSVFACVLLGGAFAQVANLEPRHPRDILIPTVTYEVVLPAESSPHYSIAVDSSGNGAYRARDLSPGTQGGNHPDMFEFTVSQPTCSKIFELARKSGYFEHRPAGVDTLNPAFSRVARVFYTLSYSYGPAYSFDLGARSVRSSISFSSTSDRQIEELTGIFDRIYRALQAPLSQPAAAGEPISVP